MSFQSVVIKNTVVFEKAYLKRKKMGHEEKSIVFALAVSIICLSAVLRVHAFPVRSATAQKGKLEA